MFFRDIIGQQAAKEKLLQMVQNNRIAHALLFISTEGNGALPLAIAFAQYINCTGDKSNGDSCGECPSCRKFKTLMHPDVHYVFPIIRSDGNSSATSNDFQDEWREQLTTQPYFSLNQWLTRLDGSKQGLISKDEGARIHQITNLPNVEGQYKVIIIWCAELMNETAANKILKILEEPPAGTIFILISENVDNILTTILSRTQRLTIPPIDPDSMLDFATSKAPEMAKTDALNLIHIANGNAVQLLDSLNGGEEAKENLDFFMSLMRISFQRNTVAMMNFAQDAKKNLSRDQLKNRLLYCLHMIREAFVYNMQTPKLNYLTEDEEAFLQKFAIFIHLQNVQKFQKTLTEAIQQLELNANAEMLVFDLLIRTAIYIKITADNNF